MAAAISAWVSSLSFMRRFPRSWAQAILLVALVAFYWRLTDRCNKETFKTDDEYFWSLKGELERVLPKVRPGAQIAYYQDGTDSWDAKFVTALFYNDRSVFVWLCQYNHLSLEELSNVDYVLSFDQKKLTILKRPGEPFRIPSSRVQAASK
jgi:hypothetical protein